jgi:signal transduction histidine kinase
VCFEVEDRGIGIPPRETKKIFQKFHQVDLRLSRRVGGVGLGLSIVQFIVKAHSGAIHVESKSGQGSKFTVSIPVAGVRHTVAAK